MQEHMASLVLVSSALSLVSSAPSLGSSGYVAAQIPVIPVMNPI